MDIESKLKREGGSHIDLGSAIYHFAPNAIGAHVAHVANDDHVARLLAIPEGFRIYKGTAYEPGAEPVMPRAVAAPVLPTLAPELNYPLGSDVHPQRFTIHDVDYSLQQIAALAMQDSGMDIAQWNAQDGDTRALAIDAKLDALQAIEPVDPIEELAKQAAGTADDDQEEADAEQADEATDKDEPELERDALAAEYEAKFNAKPHHRASAATIAAKLAEG